MSITISARLESGKAVSITRIVKKGQEHRAFTEIGNDLNESDWDEVQKMLEDLQPAVHYFFEGGPIT